MKNSHSDASKIFVLQVFYFLSCHTTSDLPMHCTVQSIFVSLQASAVQDHKVLQIAFHTAEFLPVNQSLLNFAILEEKYY